jgi:hypothetical protein
MSSGSERAWHNACVCAAEESMIGQKRVCVVMPAYNAEKTLERTVEGLDRELVDDVIVVDDGSADDTVAVAKRLGVHYVVHARNRGYGGNQKTCYKEALARHADIVVMLHPDYQYSPQLVPAMAAMVASEHFDVVLGSRILGVGALSGGMPFWKYASNRALTFVENLLIDYKLSEYHSGLRAFSRRLLEVLPLDANSDDFVFDNQMLVQAIWHGFHVGEITCPTRYFAEASSINFPRSVKYGFDVLATAVEYQAARVGLYRSPRLPPAPSLGRSEHALDANEAAAEEPAAESLGTAQRWTLGAAIVAHVVHVLVGILYFASMGQDFRGHIAVLDSLEAGPFVWNGTNPPGFYLVAHFIEKVVSARYRVELTSVFFLALNLVALAPLNASLRRLRLSADVRFASLLVLLFVPLWVVHTVVFAPDAATVPVFFTAFYLVGTLLKEGIGAAKLALTGLALAATLTFGIFTKYSFCFFLPAIAFVFVYEAWRRRSAMLLACLLSLLPAMGLGVYEYQRSAEVQGATTHGHYRKEGEVQQMDVFDLLLPKLADVELLWAPQYFEDKIYEPRRYGYWGLLHLATFTDILNAFQSPGPEVAIRGPDRPQQFFTRQRGRFAKRASAAAVQWALPMTLVAGIGVFVSLWRAARDLWHRRPMSQSSILVGFALSLYLPILASMPRVVCAYECGYWLPRLVMPSILSFLVLGFLVIDRLVQQSPARRAGLVVYACIVSGIFLAALSGFRA